jgi:putative transposase
MSYTNLLYHIVYATKERAPLITSDLKIRLHGYLGGIVNGLGCVPIEINGMSEHVHLLVKIRPTIAVSDFLSKLKSSSSSWGKRETKGRFGWQTKYGAFTVSESQVGRVRQYIRDQEKHHRKMSFEEEFEALLNSNGIEFEKQYLWT